MIPAEALTISSDLEVEVTADCLPHPQFIDGAFVYGKDDVGCFLTVGLGARERPHVAGPVGHLNIIKCGKRLKATCLEKLHHNRVPGHRHSSSAKSKWSQVQGL